MIPEIIWGKKNITGVQGARGGGKGKDTTVPFFQKSGHFSIFKKSRGGLPLNTLNMPEHG